LPTNRPERGTAGWNLSGNSLGLKSPVDFQGDDGVTHRFAVPLCFPPLETDDAQTASMTYDGEAKE